MTSTKNGPWTIVDQSTVYENPWIRVDHHDVIHPSGTPGVYGVVRFQNHAIGILPIDENGDVWLVGQHRFALDRYSWELPEGGGPKNQDPLLGAKRELQEETGLTAKHWLSLPGFDVSNSVTDEVAYCFLAFGLSPGPPQPDASEELTIRKIKFSALLDDIMNGNITDSLTILMVLMAREKALRNELPTFICEIILDSV